MDYVRLQMTGDKASDLSDAAGTLWVDVAERRWSETMLAATGLSVEPMPHLYEGTQDTGMLRPAVAELWGMPVVPVVAGAVTTRLVLSASALSRMATRCSH
jgi:xylulokinase